MSRASSITVAPDRARVFQYAPRAGGSENPDTLFVESPMAAPLPLREAGGNLSESLTQ